MTVLLLGMTAHIAGTAAVIETGGISEALVKINYYALPF